MFQLAISFALILILCYGSLSNSRVTGSVTVSFNFAALSIVILSFEKFSSVTCRWLVGEIQISKAVCVFLTHGDFQNTYQNGTRRGMHELFSNQSSHWYSQLNFKLLGRDNDSQTSLILHVLTNVQFLLICDWFIYKKLKN